MWGAETADAGVGSGAAAWSSLKMSKPWSHCAGLCSGAWHRLLGWSKLGEGDNKAKERSQCCDREMRLLCFLSDWKPTAVSLTGMWILPCVPTDKTLPVSNKLWALTISKLKPTALGYIGRIILLILESQEETKKGTCLFKWKISGKAGDRQLQFGLPWTGKTAPRKQGFESYALLLSK